MHTSECWFGGPHMVPMFPHVPPQVSAQHAFILWWLSKAEAQIQIRAENLNITNCVLNIFIFLFNLIPYLPFKLRPRLQASLNLEASWVHTWQVEVAAAKGLWKIVHVFGLATASACECVVIYIDPPQFHHWGTNNLYLDNLCLQAKRANPHQVLQKLQ